MFGSLVSISILLAAGMAGAPGGTPAGCTSEPGSGPVEAGAVLLDVVNDGRGPKAFVRVELRAHAEASFSTISRFRKTLRGEIPVGAGPLAAVSIGRGQSRNVEFLTELDPERLNHLYFRIHSLLASGGKDDLVVYLRVNLDPALEPEMVGNYIQYMGASPEDVPAPGEDMEP